MAPKSKYEYQKLKRLGAGSEGEVWMVQCPKTKQFYVVKLRKTKINHEVPIEVINFLLLKMNNHSLGLNVVQYYDYWFDSPRENTMLLEFCPAGDLTGLIEDCSRHHYYPPAYLSFHVLAHLAVAAIYIHTGRKFDYRTRKFTSPPANWNTIVHRDIKPCNVLIRSKKITGETSNLPDFILSDFGWASPTQDLDVPGVLPNGLVRESFKRNLLGTYVFIAPEFKSKMKDVEVCKLTTRSDMYQIGASVYELASGQLIDDGIWDFPKHNPKEFKEILYEFMNPEPRDRAGDTRAMELVPQLLELRDTYLKKEESLPAWMFDTHSDEFHYRQPTHGLGGQTPRKPTEARNSVFVEAREPKRSTKVPDRQYGYHLNSWNAPNSPGLRGTDSTLIPETTSAPGQTGTLSGFLIESNAAGQQVVQGRFEVKRSLSRRANLLDIPSTINPERGSLVRRANPRELDNLLLEMEEEPPSRSFRPVSHRQNPIFRYVSPRPSHLRSVSESGNLRDGLADLSVHDNCYGRRDASDQNNYSLDELHAPSIELHDSTEESEYERGRHQDVRIMEPSRRIQPFVPSRHEASVRREQPREHRQEWALPRDKRGKEATTILGLSSNDREEQPLQWVRRRGDWGGSATLMALFAKKQGADRKR